MAPRMILAAFMAAVSACPALSAPQCGPRDEVVGTLGSRYGETRRASGLAQGTGVLEVYASDETGTWTVTLTLPNGMTCLVASGDSYEADGNEERAPGEDA